MNIKIHPDANFGNITHPELMDIIGIAPKIMDRYFVNQFEEEIIIINHPEGPFINLHNKRYHIYLSAQEHYYSQFYYQFLHEYCHARTNYSKVEDDNKYGWFEESICELCSIFGMLQIASYWQSNNPISFSNQNYHLSIKNYIDNHKSSPERNLESNVLFKTWFDNNLSSLERNRYLRNSNSIIANQLLPLFESNIQLWELMTYWNTWDTNKDDTIHAAFDKWLEVIPSEKIEIANKLINMF